MHFDLVARHHGLHISPAQVTLDNHLSGAELSAEEIARCAASLGTESKARPPDVARSVASEEVASRHRDAEERREHGPRGARREVTRRLPSILHDPKAGDDAKLVDRPARASRRRGRGEVVLLRRNYDLADEEQPFSLGLIAALIMRERRMVRDLAICAMALSLFALAPIVFWRLLSDKVIYYGSLNTFTVLCIAMGVVIVFETIFAYLRIVPRPVHHGASRRPAFGIPASTTF